MLFARTQIFKELELIIEHKLMFYADDILWIVSDPVRSVPTLLDTTESIIFQMIWL